MAHDDKPAVAEYRVVTAENKVDRLIKDVNKLMDAGWVPLGGVSVSHAFDAHEERMTVLFAQALLRPN
jgi:hypothetical protein